MKLPPSPPLPCRIALGSAFVLLLVALLPLVAQAAQTATFTDSDDDTYIVKLNGAGIFNAVVADIGEGKGPLASLALEGTDTSSVLTVKVTQSATGDGKVGIGEVTGAGSLRRFSAARWNLTGNGITLGGGLGSLTFGDIADGAVVDVGKVPGLGATKITVGNIGAAAIFTDGTLKALTANSIAAGATIDAAAIGTVEVRDGGFGAALTTPGKLAALFVTGGDLTGRLNAFSIGRIKITKAKLTLAGGSIVGATIAAAKNIGPITVGGDITGSRILAGAMLGADGVLGGTGDDADAFGGGSLKSIKVEGNVTNSILGAGLSPFDGVFKDGNDGVFGAKRSKLGFLTIAGQLSGDSLVGAGVFGKVKIAGSRLRLPQLDPRFVSRRLEGVPPPAPDPTKTAPANNPTVATNLSDSTRFLYTGSNPVQTGVGVNAIEPVRAAVLRGRVLAADGSALPSVSVSILNHPEFGETLSRADGAFDMAVNGGGVLAVSFEKNGFLPAQRQVVATAQDYSMVADVVLVTPDPAVTAVEFGGAATMQIHEATMQADADGQRRALLMFQPGTSASLVMDDGSIEPMTALNIRATEFTVGPNGPAKMPATLPPTSAYTYCVDLTADEGLATGAASVLFDKPVWFYLENFLNFPTGIQVPIGFYDPVKGEWVASDSGLVIQIVGITGGAADLDVTGDGTADSGAALDTLGITDAERQQLATRYAAGQSLWRTPIPHFSTVDANWPGGSNPAGTPNGGDPTQPGPVDKPDDPPNVYIQNQTLGEQIAIVGTPFTLHYRSNRVPGYRATDVLRIPLSGPSLIGAVQRIDLEVIVAGRSFKQQFPPAPNLITSFEWDGLDAYGRLVAGAQPVTVKVSNIYRGTYRGTRRFGYVGEFELSGNLLRSETAVTAIYTRRLGNFDIRPQSIGGWTFDVHHSYDPIGRVLYQGDGTTRSVESVNGIITTIAGSGLPFTPGFNNDNIPAREARLAPASGHGPFAVSWGADGSLYFTTLELHRIFRITPDGILHIVAGTGTAGYNGDERLAKDAQLNRPEGLAVAPDGTIYFCDWGSFRVRSITPDGVIHTIVGTGVAGYSGDGGPGILAKTRQCLSLTRAVDGTLFIADANNHCIRRLGTDGIITTVAGTGTAGFSGDGGLATAARFQFPQGAVLDGAGNLFVADTANFVVRKVGPDGIVRTIAGIPGQTVSDATDPAGDGGPATAAKLGGPLGGFAAFGPLTVHLSPNGELLIAHSGMARFRQISADGIIRTVAGAGMFVLDPAAANGEGAAALQAPLGRTTGLAFEGDYGPDGALYIADGSGRIRRVAPPLPGFSAEDIALASADGTQLHRFDANGRHLDTRHAFTGAVLFTFAYAADGQLAAIADASGNVTRIRRTAAGAPTAIIAPLGQETALRVDASGSLAGLTSPAGARYSFTSRADGLITGATDPNGTTRLFSYDPTGRLTDFNSQGASRFELARAETDDGYLVTTETALGRQETYTVEVPDAGGEARTRTEPGSELTLETRSAAGLETTVLPSGLTFTETIGADPRFGADAPLGKSLTVATPGGKTLAIARERTVALANASDPLSLISWTETITRNGRATTTTFDRAAKLFDTASPAGRHVLETINDRGQTIREQVGDLAPTTISYDIRGRLFSITEGDGATARTRQLTYDAAGFIASQTDALGRIASTTRDADGRVTRLIEPGGRTLNLTRDDLGALNRLAIGGGATHFLSRTEFGALASYTAPDAGAGPAITTFDYDADEKLIKIARPGGQTINFGYDTAGRQISRTVAAGTTTFTLAPASGFVTAINAPGGVALAFNYEGPFVLGHTWTGPVTGSVAETIDNDLRPASQSVNGGNTVAFTYDADGLVTGVGALTLTRSAVNGLIASASIGGLTEAFAYDGFGERTSHTLSFGGAALWAQQLTYDALARITQRLETVAGVTDTFAYAYDPAGRLIEVRKNGAVTATYAYDTNGNRTSANAELATYDAQDRLTRRGTTTYSYTPAGDLLSKTTGGQTTQFAYDALGNLTTATLPAGTTLQYVIDGETRRLGRLVNGTLTQGFLYSDRLRIAAELDGGNAVVSRFVHAPDGGVPAYMVRGGTTYRFVTDTNGSVRLLVDISTGIVAQRLDYDAFGRVTLDTNPGFQPFGFAGGLRDPGTGLVRFGARDYDPESGRWTAKDPLLFDGGDANLYTYAANDPINARDPSGLTTSEDDKRAKKVEKRTKKRDKLRNQLQKLDDLIKSDPDAADVPFLEESRERLRKEIEKLDRKLADYDAAARKEKDAAAIERGAKEMEALALESLRQGLGSEK